MLLECDTGQEGRGAMIARLAPTRRVLCGIARHARFGRRTSCGTNERGIVQWRTHKATRCVGAGRGRSAGIAAPLIGARARFARVRTNGIDALLIGSARWRRRNNHGIARKGNAAAFIDIGTRANRGVAVKARFATARSVHNVSVGSTLVVVVL
jgi:hypothetical protein